MLFCTLFKIVFLLQAVRVESGDYCKYTESGISYSTRTTYCDYGCCGTKYIDVCCTYSYNSYGSSSSDASVPVIVSSVIGSLVGLSILIGLIKLCCAVANNSNRHTRSVIQLANTNVQPFIWTTPALHHGQSIVPVQQEAVGYSYPSLGSPPPYTQHDTVSQKTADLTCPPPQGVQ